MPVGDRQAARQLTKSTSVDHVLEEAGMKFGKVSAVAVAAFVMVMSGGTLAQAAPLCVKIE
jgi:hypothetical protein